MTLLPQIAPQQARPARTVLDPETLATAASIVEDVRARVAAHAGVELEPEVKIWGL